VLGYLFPRDAEMFVALGERAAESRIWAGIHYRSDIVAGRQLAIAVAGKVIARIAPMLGVEPRFEMPPVDRLLVASAQNPR